MNMKGTTGFLLFVLFLAGLFAPALSPAVTNLTLGTSSAGGTWYPATQVMAKIIQEEIPGVKVTVMPGGSVSNIKGTSIGTYDLALAHTQDIADGLMGAGVFKKKVTNLRGLMNLWTNYVQIAVRADSNIKTISDLKGKRIAPGQKGWGGEAATRMVLSLYNLSYKDMAKVEFTGWSGMVDLFKDRHVDAAVACSTAGVSSFQEMSLTGKGIRILPLSDEAISKADKLNPGYFKNVLPANTYKGQTTPVPTLGSTTILFCRDNLPNDLAYKITQALLKRKAELANTLGAFKELTLEFAPKIPAVTLHPGAAKFYKEKGVLK